MQNTKGNKMIGIIKKAFKYHSQKLPFNCLQIFHETTS